MSIPVSRANWRDPASYPHCLDTNPTMWAWEFLRRNLAYEVMFVRLRKKKYRSEHQKLDEFERLAVAWNISKVLDPDLSYEDLKREPSNPLDGFFFVGQEPVFVVPVFDSESDEILSASSDVLSQHLGVVAIGCSEQTVSLAHNEVALKICLDGNVHTQLSNFSKYLSQKTTLTDSEGGESEHVNRNVRFLRTMQRGKRKSEIETRTYFSERSDKRVSYKHLWYALRTVDAMASEPFRKIKERKAHRFGERDLAETTNEILKKFNEERTELLAPTYTYVQPLMTHKSENGTELRLKSRDIRGFLSFAAYYVLGRGYVAVAHADDLEAQVKKDKKHLAEARKEKSAGK